jgi:hypothetical protein
MAMLTEISAAALDADAAAHSAAAITMRLTISLPQNVTETSYNCIQNCSSVYTVRILVPEQLTLQLSSG